jgi:hypothetical protein
MYIYIYIYMCVCVPTPGYVHSNERAIENAVGKQDRIKNETLNSNLFMRLLGTLSYTLCITC